MRVAVVGGGIAGLSAAYRIAERARRWSRPVALTLFEAEQHLGGHATTIHDAGFLVETGPNAFLDRHGEHHVLRLAEDAGVASELIEANPAARRRFVAWGGRLRRAPDSPPGLIASDALTPAGKLRVLLEPWARRAPPQLEETVHEFFSRRIGCEATERLVDPAISGITAGDTRELSIAAAFPTLVEMERRHGGLIRAMLRRRRVAKPRLLSFRGGMDTLTGALRRHLGESVRTGARVRRVIRHGQGWRVDLGSDGDPPTFDRVVLATQAWQAAPLVESLDPELSRALDALPTAGLALVALAYHQRDLGVSLNGYGCLVGRGEGLETLGVVWESSLFGRRAPEGAVLVRSMLGGARHPEVVSLAEAELEARAGREAATLLGTGARPFRSWVRRFPRAITQYTRGHLGRVASIRARAARYAGLELCGTSFDGVSFNAAAASGERVAERLVPEAPRADDRAPAEPIVTNRPREEARA